MRTVWLCSKETHLQKKNVYFQALPKVGKIKVTGDGGLKPIP